MSVKTKSKLMNNLNLTYKALLPIVTLSTVFVFIPSFCFLCFFSSSIAANEDYTSYAMEQQEKVKALIEKYQTDIQKIVKSVGKEQADLRAPSFKQEGVETTNTQCLIKEEDTDYDPTESQITQPTPILVFVSFSMPKASIKGWVEQARISGAAIYIRGLVNNSFKETIAAVSELVKDTPGGLLIDPTLFKKYSITQVPAVVVVNREDFDVIYGDVTLDYALNKINGATGSGKSGNGFLIEAINKLHKKFNGV